jgi:hypothetical protein
MRTSPISNCSLSKFPIVPISKHKIPQRSQSRKIKKKSPKTPQKHRTSNTREEKEKRTKEGIAGHYKRNSRRERKRTDEQRSDSPGREDTPRSNPNLPGNRNILLYSP